jgi:hypothetical protein
MILYYESDAWRREPYYSQLKLCARPVIEIVIYIRNRAIVILPDKDSISATRRKVLGAKKKRAESGGTPHAVGLLR